ncbi:MAG: redoxin domain-containing protein [Candidatus Eremiobacteraeota bacterium]|nr:redoxin domain-containing protein [Candidatus Eremiobacteraeota bacterium]
MTRGEAIAAITAATLLVPAAASAAGAKTLEPLLNYHDWLDARPDSAALRGRVVLVDVFTFACYNCANITPNLRTLHRTKPSSELVILGVHTPETPEERDRAAVVENLKRLGIVWPVAIDNDSRLWNAYGVEYWPTQLIFDRSGRLHTTIVGDSQDADVDHTIASLLSSRAPRLLS